MRRNGPEAGFLGRKGSLNPVLVPRSRADGESRVLSARQLWPMDSCTVPSGRLFLPRLSCQCVAGAMYITGFAESISDLLSLRNIWAVRGISVAVLLALLGINLAGVKWIIRLQLLLLLLLAVSTLDFVLGSFTHLDPGKLLEFRRWPYSVFTAF